MSTLIDPSPLEWKLTPTPAPPSTASRLPRGRSAPARAPKPRPTAPAQHLPHPPSDVEKYSYLGIQRRWTFIWVFASQLALAVAFGAVMIHNPVTAAGLILLALIVPVMFVNLWPHLRRRRISLEDHIVLIEDWRRSRTEFPSVTVVLPTRGEDADVLNNSFRYTSEIEWPGRISVHVLDDADNPTTKGLAEGWGLHYSVPANRDAPDETANLISAFESTHADYLVVFDAGSAPRPDFLWETIPYLANREAGAVHAAQFFDVDSRVNEFARFSASLQEIHFRWTQPGRDTYEAATTAEDSIVYKREAVAAAGGLDVWMAGYRTRYLPVALAKGLAPDSWSAFTTQQYRVGRSSLVLLGNSVSRDASLSVAQRIFFWAAAVSQIASAAMLLLVALPVLIMVWFYPSHMRLDQYLAAVPAFLALVIVFPLLTRGWRPTILRAYVITTFSHIHVVIDAMRGTSQASARTGTRRASRNVGNIPLRAAVFARIWFFGTQLLVWAGLVHAAIIGVDVVRLWPTIALSTLAFFVLAPTLITLRPVRSRFRGQVAVPRSSTPVALVANPVFFRASVRDDPQSMELAS